MGRATLTHKPFRRAAFEGVHGGAQSNFGVGVGFWVSERMMSLQNPTPITIPTLTPIDVEFAPLCGAGQSHAF